MAALEALLVLVAFLTVARFVPSTRYWIVDLVSHFPVQYGLFCLVLIPFCLFQARPALSLLFYLLAVVNLAVLTPPRSAATASFPPHEGIRLYTANVWRTNKRLASLMRDIEREDPDVAFLQEVTPQHTTHLQPLIGKFTHCREQPMSKHRGFTLLSKWPILESEIVKIQAHGMRPAIRARLNIRGNAVVVFGLHPHSPSRAWKFHRRNAQLAWLTEQVSASADPVIVMGDLNATPYSPTFRNMLARSGLRDARDIHGWHPSWPALVPLFWIPIDHILVSEEIRVTEMARGPFVWSDHYPVIATVSI